MTRAQGLSLIPSTTTGAVIPQLREGLTWGNDGSNVGLEEISLVVCNLHFFANTMNRGKWSAGNRSGEHHAGGGWLPDNATGSNQGDKGTLLAMLAH